MYCLDSNIVIAILRGDTALRSRVSKITAEDIYVTPITLCELYKGAFLAERSEEAIALVDRFMRIAKLLDFRETACIEFGKLYKELKKIGKPTQMADLLIASIVKSNNITLVTRNKKDFVNIPGLKLEVW